METAGKNFLRKFGSLLLSILLFLALLCGGGFTIAGRLAEPRALFDTVKGAFADLGDENVMGQIVDYVYDLLRGSSAEDVTKNDVWEMLLHPETDSPLQDESFLQALEESFTEFTETLAKAEEFEMFASLLASVPALRLLGWVVSGVLLAGMLALNLRHLGAFGGFGGTPMLLSGGVSLGIAPLTRLAENLLQVPQLAPFLGRIGASSAVVGIPLAVAGAALILFGIIWSRRHA